MKKIMLLLMGAVCFTMIAQAEQPGIAIAKELNADRYFKLDISSGLFSEENFNSLLKEIGAAENVQFSAPFEITYQVEKITVLLSTHTAQNKNIEVQIHDAYILLTPIDRSKVKESRVSWDTGLAYNNF
jgi:hypothetical protein